MDDSRRIHSLVGGGLLNIGRGALVPGRVFPFYDFFSWQKVTVDKASEIFHRPSFYIPRSSLSQKQEQKRRLLDV